MDKWQAAFIDDETLGRETFGSSDYAIFEDIHNDGSRLFRCWTGWEQEAHGPGGNPKGGGHVVILVAKNEKHALVALEAGWRLGRMRRVPSLCRASALQIQGGAELQDGAHQRLRL